MKKRMAALLTLALFLAPAPAAPDAAGPAEPPLPRQAGAGAGGGGSEEGFEDFVPTEELPADSVISFPVDI